MPYLTNEHYEPYQIGDYRHENHEKYSQIVNRVVSSYIDEATLLKIKQHTTLSLYDLLTPLENHRTSKVPRPQNSFVIYRRNLQAKMALSHTTNSSFDRLDKISKVAGKKWKNETKEIKELFAFLADCAKKVHNCIFPGYVYSPRRYATIKIPMKTPLPLLNDNSHVHLDETSQTSPSISWSYNLPSTLEITPNFMDSYDDKICKILNKNTQHFL
ncbi:high mobility group box domain-containing protein [Rhizophagus clarus]|nr:high mobility group box domain-containing protein [Rhizophagus clarus]